MQPPKTADARIRASAGFVEQERMMVGWSILARDVGLP
jgi:hypothetical protein